MKRLIITLLVIAPLILGVSVYAQPVDGLIGHWPLDGNAEDASGNNLHGTLSGCTFVPDRFGIPSCALAFNGEGDYMSLPNMQPTANRSFSVSVWVWYQQFANWSRIVDLGNGLQVDNIILANSSTTNDLCLQAVDGTVWNPQPLCATNALQPNQWIHLAATVDSNADATIYLNGEEIATGAVTISPVSRTSNYVGRSHWPVDSYFHGMMDDLYLYNRALSNAEVRSLCEGTCPPTSLPFVDNFESPTLDSCWSWVNEDTSHWSLTTRSGWMQIVTQRSYAGSAHNILVRPKPLSPNYSFETHLQFEPWADFHSAGILLWKSAEHVIELFRSKTADQGQVIALQSVDLECGPQLFPPNILTDIYFRGVVIGDVAQFYWSSDGIQWNYVGQNSCPWLSDTDVRIGLMVHNGDRLPPEIPADFDYFKIEQLSDSILAVELMSFDAVQSENSIRLNFSTASETNSNRFEIMRGTSEIGEFSRIADLTSQGSSATGHQYDYLDSDVLAGRTYWYYLADIDLSGTRTEHRHMMRSAMVAAGNALPLEYSLRAYPNPFNPTTTIFFTLPTAERIRICVFDINGRVIRSLADGSFAAGEHRLAFEAGDLATGIYFVRIQSGSFVTSIKTLLMK
jgi:hypothetical protein